MALTFGIFDHMDSSGAPLQAFYEDRLRLIEAYDRYGFDVYQVAEHHSTPLGMAASPGIFLSSVVQRTKRLRFGPMVYTLPLYHPLRLMEEICMLDQLSGGRLEVGIGKGISPIETGFFGIDPANNNEMFGEALDVILQGLSGKPITLDGKFYQFNNVPHQLTPFQKPYPPLWYGVVLPDSAERAAKQGLNVLTNTATASVRAVSDRYWEHYKARAGMTASPKFGMNRFIVIAEDERAAWDIARRAYRRWHDSFMYLWRTYGIDPTTVSYPPEIDGQAADGRAIIGTPQFVLESLHAQIEEAGVNHIGCRFAFGDLTLAESLRSVELFAEHVMPKLSANDRAAAEQV